MRNGLNPHEHLKPPCVRLSFQELNFTGCTRGELTGDNLLLHAAARCRAISSLDASWSNVNDNGVMAMSESCSRSVPWGWKPPPASPNPPPESCPSPASLLPRVGAKSNQRHPTVQIDLRHLSSLYEIFRIVYLCPVLLIKSMR